MKKLLVAILLFIIPVLAQNKKPLTVEDMWAMKRIGSVELSPDGKTIAFTVTTYSMENNKGNTDIYLINADGRNLRALKNSEKNEGNPQFSPNGKQIAYSLGGQIWVCDYNGNNSKQITDIYSEASGFEWSHDGNKLLFVSTFYPDCKTQDCNKARDKKQDESKVKAKILTHLMYKSWNRWLGDKRDHLFVYDLKSKKYTDLNSMKNNDIPPLDLGSGNDYNFSPDDNEVAFTMNPEERVQNSTNNEIYVIDLKTLKEKKISQSLGADAQPVYSPDGNYIAFTSMKRAGFEADKKVLTLYDRKTGKLKSLAPNLDRSIGEFIWSPDSKSIYFTSANEIFNSVYKLTLNDGTVTRILKDHVNSNLNISSDGKTIYFTQQRSNLPYEIFSMNSNGKNIKQITHINADLLSKIEMIPIETFWSKAAGENSVQSILVKPPFFDATKKYPMIFLIHGGPQGHWTDDFHYRWNIQLFASKGYVVVATNPRGSVGYGQKFTDEISLDWGGKVYTDLMNAYDYALSNFKFIDSKNTFAAGASYGGYMINWIEGHTDRFNALVSHDGVFNTESMWGTTEELWFPEWEFGGTPWENRLVYEKWSPHRFIHNAKTPMLIVQGANDFRVPEEQAFQLFTSLQRLGVPSKLIYFPDEYHFVTKPQNARLWWNSIFDWFEKYKKE